MTINVDAQQLSMILRILVAGICGILIGLERKNRSKEAGVRTHCVVACGSALMMIISKYGFFDMPNGADGARIAAQVVSGIGFLGAGMIFVHKNTITGLTTAAGIWATSGLGMAIGAGMYTVGIAATFIILVAQIVLHLDFKHSKHIGQKVLSIKDVDKAGYQNEITTALKESGVEIFDVKIEVSETGLRSYKFTIEIPSSINEDDILSMTDYRCSIKSI